MKRVTLLCGMLLAMTAGVAAAGQGVNIRWNACLSDGGAINRNFACNSNNGSNSITGSFVLEAPLNTTSGNEIVVDLASASPVLPAWWQFRNAGTCRQSSMTFNTVISATALGCFDWANGGATGGIGAYNIGLRGPNTARMVAASAVPISGLANLDPGTEYFSFNLIVNNLKSVGSGLCGGCQDAICIVFNSINLTTPIATNNRKLVGPSNGFDTDFVTWQGGGGVVVGGVPGCGAATPTKNSTWGAVKSLYR